jgi:CHAT domain-containing protein
MKLLPLLLITSICFFSSCKKTDFSKEIAASCAQIDTALLKQDDTLALRQTLENAYNLADKYSTKKHDSLTAALSKAMGASQDKGIDSRYYYQKGLNYGTRHLPIDNDLIMRLYRNTGMSFFYSDDYPVSLRYFDSVKINSTDKTLLKIKTQNTINIAQCYQYLKDYTSAEHFYGNALDLANTSMTEKESAFIYMRYSSCLRLEKKYAQSIEMANKVIHILQVKNNPKDLIRADSTTLAGAYFHLAFAYQDSTLFTLATQNYYQALDFYQKLHNLDNQTGIYVNQGLAYRYNRQYNEAIYTLSQGIELLNKKEKLSESLHLRQGLLYLNRAEVHLDLNEYPRALIDQDSAISYLTQYNTSPSLTALLLTKRYNLLSLLGDRAKIYNTLADQGKDPQGYQKALQLFDQIVSLSDDIRADYLSDNAKLSLSEEIKPAFEKAIELCHALFQKTNNIQYLQQAYAFAEHSRSMILNENTHLNNHLPQELQKENDQLKKLESTLLQSTTKSLSTDFQTYLQQKRAFREKIKTYNRSQTTTIPIIQKILLADKKTTLLEYFVGDSAIYLFTLAHKDSDVRLLRMPKSPQFNDQITKLRAAILTENNTQTDQLSQQIYNQIIPPSLSENPNTTRLIVIPDGALSYIPFDILPINDEPTTPTPSLPLVANEKTYLLQKYTISYAPSASYLVEETNRPTSQNHQPATIFAPQYLESETKVVAKVNPKPVPNPKSETRNQPTQLPQAQQEATQIQKTIGGILYTNDQATESNFILHAPQAQILHLAMHAQIDEDNPENSKFLFPTTNNQATNDNQLTAAKINAMSLQADLAVLSACNTGSGKLAKGEGVMSLSRAFHYAGVPATVTSLWKVPDTETSEIMINFYKKLKTGIPKDQALREAKLQYLSQVRLEAKSAPLYWAAFVLSGKTQPIDFENHQSKYRYWLIGILIAGILLYKYKKQ